MLRFSKYQGTGNDFVVLDKRAGGAPLPAAAAVFLCDRHRGIGADGVLTLWKEAGHDFRMQVQNADGSRISLWQALLRFVVSIASWLCVGLGFIWSLFDKQKRSWHDISSDTQLVRIPK